MIIGTGIDIIEIGRIRTALTRGSFGSRFFSEEERRYCDSRGVHRAASYAARFAGKEALVKALGTGFSGGRWQDIEIVTDEAGRPRVKLAGFYAEVAAGLGVTAIHISLSHAREYAAAQVVLWGGASQ